MSSEDEVQLTAGDILAELSERGQIEWELAKAKATNRKLAAMVMELQRGEKPKLVS